jgi:hypothetical protein
MEEGLERSFPNQVTATATSNLKNEKLDYDIVHAALD